MNIWIFRDTQFFLSNYIASFFIIHFVYKMFPIKFFVMKKYVKWNEVEKQYYITKSWSIVQICPSALLLTKAQMKKFDFVLVHTY